MISLEILMKKLKNLWIGNCLAKVIPKSKLHNQTRSMDDFGGHLHVQLAHERVKVRVLKIMGENDIRKVTNFFNNNCCAHIIPATIIAK